ncbi:MAG: hypothetical protein JNM17_33205 [Archangium sp.]|nr:hypothetical protein [Archangium sp.]
MTTAALLAALLLAQRPVVYGGSDDYDRALRARLGLGKFNKEVSGADFALRATVRPSFHPECSVTFVRRGRKSEGVVRCAKESIWHSLQTSSSTVSTPIVERFLLSPSEIQTLENLTTEIRTWKEDRDKWLEDGMLTTFETLASREFAALEVQHLGGAPNAWIIALTKILSARAPTVSTIIGHWSAYLE